MDIEVIYKKDNSEFALQDDGEVKPDTTQATTQEAVDVPVDVDFSEQVASAICDSCPEESKKKPKDKKADKADKEKAPKSTEQTERLARQKKELFIIVLFFSLLALLIIFIIVLCCAGNEHDLGPCGDKTLRLSNDGGDCVPLNCETEHKCYYSEKIDENHEKLSAINKILALSGITKSVDLPYVVKVNETEVDNTFIVFPNLGNFQDNKNFCEKFLLKSSNLASSSPVLAAIASNIEGNFWSGECENLEYSEGALNSHYANYACSSRGSARFVCEI